MAITNNRLTKEQYEQNFSDIHPPFENKNAALVEANRCLFCYDAPVPKAVLPVLMFQNSSNRSLQII